MERRLFDDLVVSRGGRKARVGGMPLSFVLHGAALAGLLALSLAAPAELPPEHGRTIIDEFPRIATARAAPADPAPRAVRPRRPTSRPAVRTVAVPLQEPIGLVESTTPEPETDTAPGVLCVGCAPVDAPSGSDGTGEGPFGGDGSGADGPVVGPVRVGGEVQPPRKIRHADPVFPELAKRARVSGVVVLDCVIDREGRVSRIEVVSGNPLLDEAAVTAVRQWAYRPTLLNGVPVEVVMTVTVRFRTR
jgi:protein TonB